MWNRIRRTSGIRVLEAAVLAVLLPLAAGCNYTLQAGAGLPGHIRTPAIVPFENETDRFELPQELYDVLLDEVPRNFGVQTAGEEFADAIIRGSVRRYSVEAPSFRPDATGDRTDVIEREVLVAVEIQVIDRVNSVILWENTNLTARGEFLEATQLEEDGRRRAVERIAQAVVDGLQANW